VPTFGFQPCTLTPSTSMPPTTRPVIGEPLGMSNPNRVLLAWMIESVRAPLIRMYIRPAV